MLRFQLRELRLVVLRFCSGERAGRAGRARPGIVLLRFEQLRELRQVLLLRLIRPDEMGAAVTPAERLRLHAELFDAKCASGWMRELSGPRHEGRRTGSFGHAAARAYLAGVLVELGLDVESAAFQADGMTGRDAPPVLESRGAGEAGATWRTWEHRVDYAEHPRSAFAAELREGTATAHETVSAGQWHLGAALPDGTDLDGHARALAERGVHGLLLPQGRDEAGILTKRLAGGSELPLPVISVRPDLLRELEGQTLRASMPLRRGSVHGTNLITRIPAGSDDGRAPIVLCAHYDGVGSDPGRFFPAAGDNATGAAVLLELAHVARELPLRRPLILALVDAEEIGAQGSRAHARALREQGQAVSVLNLDMAGTWHGRAAVELGPDTEELREALDQAGRALHLPLALAPVASDNRSYAAEGFPAVGIGLGSAHYHSPLDAPDTVDPEGLAKAGQLLLATVFALACQPDEKDAP